MVFSGIRAMSEDQDLITVPRVEWERLKKTNERLASLAITDALTGVGNYRAFTDRLDQLLAEADRGRSFSVVFVDIDHFKEFNDVYGHPTGDMVLHRVAQCLKSKMRRVDFVARYGGEEFVCLLPDTEIEGASTLAGRLCGAVAEMRIEDLPQVTVSIGVCSYAHARTREDIVECAVQHLYKAKSAGRNQISVCEDQNSRLKTLPGVPIPEPRGP